MGERVYQGRFKGNTDTHIPNEKTRESHDRMKWNSPQFCEECWSKPCRCEEDQQCLKKKD